MKQYFSWLLTFLLTIFSLKAAFAYDGIVIVLEAPLLKEPAMSAKVMQTLRKGQRVYIPNHLISHGEAPEFIPTFDRAGNPVFIPSKYVKVVLNNSDEKIQPITFAGHDPTDYRLEEPIPSTYPFENRHYLRASTSLFLGSNHNTPYGYNTAFSKQRNHKETGIRITVTRKAEHDKYERFYYGMIGSIATAKSDLVFMNMNQSKESRDTFRVGPWITYDAFKNDRYRLTIGTGFTYNFHRAVITAFGSAQGFQLEETRSFTGYSISPLTSTTFQITDFFPNMDFIGGLDLSLFLSHTQKSSDQIEVPELWNPDSKNYLTNTFKPQVAGFLGIQFKY